MSAVMTSVVHLYNTKNNYFTYFDLIRTIYPLSYLLIYKHYKPTQNPTWLLLRREATPFSTKIIPFALNYILWSYGWRHSPIFEAHNKVYESIAVHYIWSNLSIFFVQNRYNYKLVSKFIIRVKKCYQFK